MEELASAMELSANFSGLLLFLFFRFKVPFIFQAVSGFLPGEPLFCGGEYL